MRAPLCIVAFAALAAGCGENLTHPGELPDAGGLTCLPDLDGRIDAEELSGPLGASARYLVGENKSVDIAGEVDGAGRRIWDWSAPESDDVVVEIATVPVAGAWFAASFPAGQFAAPLDVAGATLGVYRQDEEALWLLGLASAEESPAEGRTLLVYAAPVALIRFPLVDGLEWTSVGEIAAGGTLRGLPYAGRDVYSQRVDGAGRMELPELAFTQALRVRTRVSVEPSVGDAVTRRQVLFLFECFGEVARASSRDGESQEDFTQAAELRRRTF